MYTLIAVGLVCLIGWFADFPALTQVTHTGVFGVVHVGGPTKQVPAVANNPYAAAMIAAGMPDGVAQRSVPEVWPRWSDFTVDGNRYLKNASRTLSLPDSLLSEHDPLRSVCMAMRISRRPWPINCQRTRRKCLTF
jgi:hypothetical protein